MFRFWKIDSEDLDSLYENICTAINTNGPVAVIIKRPMCPGIEGLEGSNHGHDVISVKLALELLRNQQSASRCRLFKKRGSPQTGKGFSWLQ